MGGDYIRVDISIRKGISWYYSKRLLFRKVIIPKGLGFVMSDL